MIKKTALSISTFLLALFLLVPLASADTINLTLSSPVQTGTAGSTLSFDATALAISDGLGTVFLNSDNIGHLDAPLTLDDSGFFGGFPLSMSAGDSFTGLLFTVFLPGDITPGIYTGTFSILGGLNQDDQLPLATVDFTVNATAPSAVPEPSTYALMATGVGALMIAGFMRRRSGIDDAA